MKKSLVKAPLVHVVLDLKFAELPSLKNISEELENRLHDKMIEIGFPEIIRSKVEGFDLKIDPFTQSMTQEKHDSKRLLFRAAGQRSIVEISPSSIQLKATKYSSFDDFYKLFKEVVLAVHEFFKLDRAVVKALELRYIDIIVPTKAYQLSDFVIDSYLSPDLFKKFKHLQGQKVNVVETAVGQLIVNFAELPTVEGKVNQILPHDLMEPDQNCTLIIEGQQEWLSIIAPTYGLLDMRHIHPFVGSPLFSIEHVDQKAQALYQDVSDVFWGSLSDIALREWEVKGV
ncbi:TIGR04255 family protein [Acinetobacter baumannii]|uniref:TIGR04255 family protein n=1 Tax=Acinetobacter sp. 1179249 TaxID=1310790 RepID=UPI00044CECAE|nr:TIGR04255 family protein [Acinetobacter sp. 1179249]EXR29878.1 TIGR04255 family protein [Acinetobacter sp. 1179249]